MTEPRFAAQLQSPPPVVRDLDAPIREACEAAGPLWEPGGRHFEKARGIVARKLKWKSENVMAWEVRSYLRIDRPAWAEREGLVIP